MTIPVEQTRYIYRGPYSIGDTIPIPFSYSDETDVKLYLDDSPLEINVGYGVTGQNINVLTNIGSGTKVVVQRETPLDNDAEFPQEADFDSEKINNAFDKVTRQNQEQDEILSRAIKMPVDTDKDLLKGITFPSPNPNKAIQWNSSGTNLTNSAYGVDDLVNKVDEAIDKVDGVTVSLEEIQRLEASSQNWANTSRSWAVGSDTERPEGSAKWWAQQTAQTVQMDSYTKAEIDKMINNDTLPNIYTGAFLTWKDNSTGTDRSPRLIEISTNDPKLIVDYGRYFRFTGYLSGTAGIMQINTIKSLFETINSLTISVPRLQISNLGADYLTLPVALKLKDANNEKPTLYLWDTDNNKAYTQDTLPDGAFFVGLMDFKRSTGDYFVAQGFSIDNDTYGAHRGSNIKLDFIAKTYSETQWDDLSDEDKNKIALAFVVEEP